MPAAPLLTRPGLKGPQKVGGDAPGYGGPIQIIPLGNSNFETNGGNVGNPDIRTATDAASYSNTSWSPAIPGGVVAVAVMSSLAAGECPQPVVSGNGVAWVNWYSLKWGPSWFLGIYACDATNFQAGVTTIDYGGTTVRSGDALFCQIFGLDLSDGVAAAVVQRGFTATGGTALTLSLPTVLANPLNRVLAASAHQAQDDTRPNSGIAATQGFVTLAQQQGAGPARGNNLMWRPDAFNPTGNTIGVAYPGNVQGALIALELRAQSVDTVNKGYAPVGPSWVSNYPAGRGVLGPTRGPKIWIGQRPSPPPAATGNVTVDVTTAGAITWTGSQVALVVTVAPSAGAITWTGSDAPLSVKIPPTAGNITWTGSAVALTVTIAPTAGAITWAGSAVPVKATIAPSAGAITWNGSAVALVISIAPTAGAITWNGQATPLKVSVAVAAGNITWNGQTITLSGPTNIIVNTPGAITWTGSSVGLVTTIAPTAGALQWAGQQVALKTLLAISPGAITWAGGTVSFGPPPAVPVSPADFSSAAGSVASSSKGTALDGAGASVGVDSGRSAVTGDSSSSASGPSTG